MSIAVASIRPFSRLASPADAVRFFTPNWFAATMGTGILAIALGQFPDMPLLFAAGTALWLFNIALFALFTALYTTRWITHFSGAKRILAHSSMSMSLGCIPMGLALCIGGALSNALDRLLYGAVADFFHFHWQHYSFYIFNIADMAITLGVILLIADMFGIGRPRSAKA